MEFVKIPDTENRVVNLLNLEAFYAKPGDATKTVLEFNMQGRHVVIDIPVTFANVKTALTNGGHTILNDS